MHTRRSSLFAIWPVLLLASPTALSSDIPLSGQCGYMCHVPMMEQGGAGAMASRGLRPLEGDISQMKARFAIRPDQEGAWSKFEKVVNAPLPDPHKAMGSGAPKSSVDRAKFMKELWDQRYAQMSAVTAAFKDLYKVLDDDQRIIANQRFGYCELIR